MIRIFIVILLLLTLITPNPRKRKMAAAAVGLDKKSLQNKPAPQNKPCPEVPAQQVGSCKPLSVYGQIIQTVPFGEFYDKENVYNFYGFVNGDKKVHSELLDVKTVKSLNNLTLFVEEQTKCSWEFVAQSQSSRSNGNLGDMLIITYTFKRC